MRGREASGWREKRIIVCFCSERVLFFGAAERRPLFDRVYQWDRSSEITRPDSRPQTWSPRAAGGGLLEIISPIQRKAVSTLGYKERHIGPVCLLVCWFVVCRINFTTFKTISVKHLAALILRALIGSNGDAIIWTGKRRSEAVWL